MKTHSIIIFLALSALLASCSTEKKDMTAPEIVSAGEETSPLNCAEYHPGDIIQFVWAFSDDVELGSFNVEIHSNHDHHTHSTEAEDCPEHHHGEGEEEGELWIFNEDYPIPSGQTYYKTNIPIAVPANAAHGEYHFMIRVTDAAGWQQLRSLAINIEE